MKPTYAFPLASDYRDEKGMTLRDYFAGQVLAGLMAHETIEHLEPIDIAERAYSKADAMLEVRKDTPND